MDTEATKISQRAQSMLEAKIQVRVNVTKPTRKRDEHI